MQFAHVAVPVPVRQLFTYKIPHGMETCVGSRVFVPFSNRTVAGYVMQIGDSCHCEELKRRSNPPSKFVGLPRPFGARNDIKPTLKTCLPIKEILEALDDEPVFSQKMVELIKWLANYYCVPIGEMCRAAVPNSLSKKTKKKREFLPKETIIEDIFRDDATVKLSESQERAYGELNVPATNPLAGRPCSKFKTTLLHGVTGSGKTEVYLRLFADIINAGKQAIFLVPEIGMTPQTIGRLTSRFGAQVAVYHSGLTDARRFYEWQRMQKGDAKIVIGTRSAIFAPFKKLGLIVIDEEHDPSYKQEEAPRYNGRDAAVMRAKLEDVPCILGSATPSMESFANTKAKKYHYIHLPDRPTGAALPEVEIVDMREVQKKSNLSPGLVNSILETLQKKEQVILFLNKRGFASFVLCEDCGNTFVCPNCNITLSYHKGDRSLMCHYCDYKTALPSLCIKCQGKNLKTLGTGTERIEEEITKYFPGACVARFDRDSTTKAGARLKILSQMKSGHIDILVGTQMITKGHDFPNVTLVGVLDADMSLNFPDFRAPERTFQLLTQVAGRSGRGDIPGRVIIQTYFPEHYSIEAASRHDFFKFYDEELPHRRELSYPPFGRLAMIRVQGTNEAEVEKYIDRLTGELRATSHNSQVTILGPAPAPLYKIRNKYRWQLLLKSNNINKLRRLIDATTSFADKPPRGTKVIIDVDPINML